MSNQENSRIPLTTKNKTVPYLGQFRSEDTRNRDYYQIKIFKNDVISPHRVHTRWVLGNNKTHPEMETSISAII